MPSGLTAPGPHSHRLAAAFDPQRSTASCWSTAPARCTPKSGFGDFAVDPWGVLRRRGEREVVPYIYAGLQFIAPALLAGMPDGAFSMNLAWDIAMAAGRLRAVVHDGLVVPSLHAGRPGRGGEHPAGATDGRHALNLFTIPLGVPSWTRSPEEWRRAPAIRWRSRAG